MWKLAVKICYAIVLKLVVNIHLISNLSWRTAPKLEMVNRNYSGAHCLILLKVGRLVYCGRHD